MLGILACHLASPPCAPSTAFRLTTFPSFRISSKSAAAPVGTLEVAGAAAPAGHVVECLGKLEEMAALHQERMERIESALLASELSGRLVSTKCSV